MENEEIRDAVLEAIETSLDAQLRAVRKLRKGETEAVPEKRGMSQIDMAFNILSSTQSPMHVTEIIEKIRQRFDQQVDRESLVSALTKRVARGDRFVRTDKNTFAVREESAK